MKTPEETRIIADGIKSRLTHRSGEAEWFLPRPNAKPIKIFASETILNSFDDGIWEQIENMGKMPGAEEVIIQSDAHVGYGCPVGCTVVSSTHVYPPVVGPDALCSMSMLQTDLDQSMIVDKSSRRALINAICERIPTGAGARQAVKARKIDNDILYRILYEGVSEFCLGSLGIPSHWRDKCENACFGQDKDIELMGRIDEIFDPKLSAKLLQLGSVGAGNHFISADIPTITDESLAAHFGIKSGKLSFLTHCGSRGFGYNLMEAHTKGLKNHFEKWNIPFPGGDNHLISAPLGTPEADNYLLDLYLAANFAVVNHLLINAYLLEAVQEVFPGTKGDLVHHISHNVGQEEILDGKKKWVWRKGATRAFPANHPQLKDTIYEKTGHPILLPGNARDGSVVMVAEQGSSKSCGTINHGGGRRMGRKQAKRELNQAAVEQDLMDSDILYNGRVYPLDEAPDAYKSFDAVTDSVVKAGLARVVAKLVPRFVIKDMDKDPEGAA